MKELKKNQIQKLFIASSLVVFTGIVSCSKDEGLDPDTRCNNWSEKYLTQAEAYANASIAYSNDPTTSNCNKVKEEGLNYVNALEGITSCVPTGNLSEFNKSIKELKAEINSADCDN